MTYAIVKTGGKQYRVEQGQTLLIERLPEDEGASVELEPLLYVDGATVVDGADIGTGQGRGSDRRERAWTRSCGW